MKYGMMCLNSIQGVITKTTQVWSSIVDGNWKEIKDIEELHAFLSFNQSGGNVGIYLLDLMVQGNNRDNLTGSDGKSRNLQDQGRDWMVGQLYNKQ